MINSCCTSHRICAQVDKSLGLWTRENSWKLKIFRDARFYEVTTRDVAFDQSSRSIEHAKLIWAFVDEPCSARTTRQTPQTSRPDKSNFNDLQWVRRLLILLASRTSPEMRCFVNRLLISLKDLAIKEEPIARDSTLLGVDYNFSTRYKSSRPNFRRLVDVTLVSRRARARPPKSAFSSWFTFRRIARIYYYRAWHSRPIDVRATME